AALASYPAGYLSDRFGRKIVLLFGFLTFLSVYANFGFSTDTVVLGFSFASYGVFQGIFRAVGKAFASDFAPAEFRASAVGWSSATVGFSGLAASIVGGELWEIASPSATFIYGAIAALLGSAALIVFVHAGK